MLIYVRIFSRCSPFFYENIKLLCEKAVETFLTSLSGIKMAWEKRMVDALKYIALLKNRSYYLSHYRYKKRRHERVTRRNTLFSKEMLCISYQKCIQPSQEECKNIILDYLNKKRFLKVYSFRLIFKFNIYTLWSGCRKLAFFRILCNPSLEFPQYS